MSTDILIITHEGQWWLIEIRMFLGLSPQQITSTSWFPCGHWAAGVTESESQSIRPDVCDRINLSHNSFSNQFNDFFVTFNKQDPQRQRLVKGNLTKHKTGFKLLKAKQVRNANWEQIKLTRSRHENRRSDRRLGDKTGSKVRDTQGQKFQNKTVNEDLKVQTKINPEDILSPHTSPEVKSSKSQKVQTQKVSESSNYQTDFSGCSWILALCNTRSYN